MAIDASPLIARALGLSPAAPDRALRQRAAQEMLVRALAATGSVAWSLDLRTGEIERSANAAEVYGLLPGSRLGRGHELLHPADLGRYRAAHADAVRRGGAYTISFRLIRPIDGRVCWMEEHGRVYEGEDGRVRLMAGIVVDVTERHAEQLARGLENAALRALAEPAPEPRMLQSLLRAVCEEMGWELGVVWRVDAEVDQMRAVADWSPRGSGLAPLLRKTRGTGRRRGEGLCGLAWARGRSTVIHDLAALDGMPRAAAAARSGLRSAYLLPIHGRRRIIGMLEFFTRSVEPMPPRLMEALERVSRQLGSALERRHAEEQLSRQRAQLQLILDAVPAMIWFKDGRNRVLRCNEAAARWFGRPVEEIEGRSARELFPERGESHHHDDLAVIRSGKPRLGLVEKLVSPAGETRWIRRDLIPYDQGRTRGVVIFALDVTALQEAKEAVRERERQREFVANVSHEFRTPVAAIKGFAETLRQGAFHDRRNGLKFVKIIEQQADRLRDLIEDLLTLSALEGGADLKTQPLDLAEVARHYVGTMGLALKRRDVRVGLSAPKPVPCAGHRAYLLQAVENLMSNAAKFSKPGGRVRVAAARLDTGEARLTVRDDGIGISEEDRRKLFTRFFRVEKDPSRGSSGLGLNIVKKIVEAHRGRIEVESRLGKGTAVHITLPAPSQKR